MQENNEKKNNLDEVLILNKNDKIIVKKGKKIFIKVIIA